MIAAIWLGPQYSTVIALLGDLLGAILFPFGPYFPGFTVSAAISGFVYGIFLNKSKREMTNRQFLIRLALSSFLVLIVVNVFITSVWIHLLYGKAYVAIMASRVVTQIVMFPIQIGTIYALEKFLRPFMSKYLLEET